MLLKTKKLGKGNKMKIKFILPMLALVSMLFIAAPAQAGDKININSATIGELQSVKGIGPKTAEAIVAYRSEYGSFKSVDELENVKGIGEKSLKKFEGNLIAVKAGADQH
jgi:competence protein ComEA